MKKNSKRLIILVIITIIAMFIVADMASARSPRIQGQYASTGSGTCINALWGFDSSGQPQPPPSDWKGPVWITQSFTSEGVFMFNGDGTGATTAHNRFIAFPYPLYPSGAIVAPSAAVQTVTYDFHYSMVDDVISLAADLGTYFVKFTYGPNASKTFHFDGFSRTGDITPDGKTITLNGGAPDIMTYIPTAGDSPMPPNAQVMCNGTFVLIWQNDSDR